MYFVLGPCSAESYEQLYETAQTLRSTLALKRTNIVMERTASLYTDTFIFRAGVWKPRTSPASFEGYGEQALQWLARLQNELHISCATEIATPEQAQLALQAGIHYLWLGARTTANPLLVKEICNTMDDTASRCTNFKGVLVKNPISPDLGLWIGAIQRVQQTLQGEAVSNRLHQGEERQRASRRLQVIAVHRGFFTENPSPYRNAPLWSIPIELKRRMPNLPLLCDASHIAGKRELIPALLQTAADLNYDGLMLEAHPHPEQALSDAQQQFTPAQLIDLLSHIQWHTNKQPAELLALRQEIDDLDNQLWALVEKRLQLSQKIGQLKRAENLPILQTARYNDILTRRLQWAKENGISDDTVQSILSALHEESIRWQK